VSEANRALVVRARELVKRIPADEQRVIVVDGRFSRELLVRIAHAALRGGLELLQGRLDGSQPPPSPPLALPPANEPDRDVMTADEVAAFLGVDRNTVYDYAGRGVIPHQRLGKRMLFRRGAIVEWLDSSCKSARRGSR